MNDIHTYSIEDLTALKGKRVVIRVDLNLPTSDGKILDRTRLDMTIPFLKQLFFAGAKVILLSHFGDKGESIVPVAELLSKSLPEISFIPSTNFDDIRAKIATLTPGDGVLLENTRCFKGETENLPSLAREFASLGDMFINNAFSVSHRDHASVVGIAQHTLSYLGPNVIQEVTQLAKAAHPEKPALLIIGGAKISTKMELIRTYLDQGVRVFVGGAMVHNILKERGIAIGDSLYDPTYKLTESFYNHPMLLTPLDVQLADGKELAVDKVPTHGVIVDCGKETLKLLEKEINAAKTIVVNGPLGFYEKGFLYGTEHMLSMVAQAHGAKTYIGGGDTLAVAEKIHVLKNMTFVSGGGGAMLDYLAHGTLPGIDAVTQRT